MTMRILFSVILVWVAARELPAQEEAAGEVTPLKLELTMSPAPDGSDPGRPSFHTFRTSSSLRLRDGESVQLVGGSDGSPGSLREVEAKLEVLRD